MNGHETRMWAGGLVVLCALAGMLTADDAPPRALHWPAMEAAVGFNVSVGRSVYDRHLADGTWDNPTDAEGANILRARILGGDCPRYQAPNPVDMGAAFALYRTLAGDEAARALLTDAFRWQARIPVEDGGHPIETLFALFDALAAANGMSDVMDQVGEEYGR